LSRRAIVYVAKPDASYAWHVRACYERHGAEILDIGFSTNVAGLAAPEVGVRPRGARGVCDAGRQ